MAVSDGIPTAFALFVGPKDVNLLKSVNPKLEQVVDFGWLSLLAKPLFLLVNWFNGGFRAQLRMGDRADHHRSELASCSRCGFPT